ncbi:MAG: hypothetical protein K0U63_08715 [Cyanobacteria bacterium]|nr:hypothetical protein [Cyanobacteriota bacterium]
MREPPLHSGEPFSRQVFNNADSYAQAFDEAWQEHGRLEADRAISVDAKMALILDQLKEHPFHQKQPQRAVEVAAFRVRLLGL